MFISNREEKHSSILYRGYLEKRHTSIRTLMVLGGEREATYPLFAMRFREIATCIVLSSTSIAEENKRGKRYAVFVEDFLGKKNSSTGACTI
jgi:hypothetical protein